MIELVKKWIEELESEEWFKYYILEKGNIEINGKTTTITIAFKEKF